MKIKPNKCPVCGEMPVAVVNRLCTPLVPEDLEKGTFSYGFTDRASMTAVQNDQGARLVHCASNHEWYARGNW